MSEFAKRTSLPIDSFQSLRTFDLLFDPCAKKQTEWPAMSEFAKRTSRMVLGAGLEPARPIKATRPST